MCVCVCVCVYVCVQNIIKLFYRLSGFVRWNQAAAV